MRRLSPFLLVLAVALAYADSLGGPFVFDDLRCIPANPWIRSLGWDAFRSPGDRSTVDGRPLVSFTLALDYAIGGLDVRVYHATNLLIHLGAVLALYGFVRRPLGDAAAFASALLWGLHPLQTESVTYVIQRTESLMGLLCLTTLYAFVRSLESPRPARWRALALASCALGMAAKEVMVVAPVLVLLYDRCFAAGSFLEALRLRRGFYAALGLCWGVLAAAVLGGTQTMGAGFGYRGLTPWTYLLTEAGVLLHYLRLALWPQPLALDYAWPPEGSLASALPALGVLGVLLAAAFLALKARPRTGFWAAWFFLLLAPTSSVMPIADPAFEHRTYLALLGPAVLAGSFLGSRPRLLGVLALLMGARTMHRNADYETSARLWAQTVRVRPCNARAHGSLGRALGERGLLDPAARQFTQAIRLKPGFALAWSDLGIALFRQGRMEEAEACFRKALTLAPQYPVPIHYLSRIGRGKSSILPAHGL